MNNNLGAIRASKMHKERIEKWRGEEFCVSQFVTSGRCTTLIIPSFLRVHVISGRKIAPAARRLSGDRFTFVRSQWSWSWSLLRPFTFGWKKDATAKPRSLVFPSLVTDCNMPRIPWRKWLENLLILEIYEYFHHGIGKTQDVSNPCPSQSPPLDLKKFFEPLKFDIPEFQRISLFQSSSSFYSLRNSKFLRMEYDFSPFLNLFIWKEIWKEV